MSPVHYSTLGQYQARHQAGGNSQKSSAVIQQLIHSSNYYISNSNAARVHYSSSFEPDMIAAPPNDGDLCQDAKYLDEMKTKHRYQRPKRQRYKMTVTDTGCIKKLKKSRILFKDL